MKKLLVTTTAAMSIGAAVFAATPASADTAIWDKVATCESTNNWSINTGNGFYGGLQFTISTWNSFGGQEFADRADHATKAEQITVAQRVLAVQGPGAWPVCSKYAGLTKENGGAVDYTPKRSTTSTSRSTATETSTPKRAANAKTEYMVKPGDTLIQIARAHGYGENWSAIYNLNKAEIQNPDLIYVGQHFVLN